MLDCDPVDWQQQTVTPEQALTRIEPGMSIFIGTGVSEPRTLVRRLMQSDAGNLQDLELVQLAPGNVKAWLTLAVRGEEVDPSGPMEQRSKSELMGTRKWSFLAPPVTLGPSPLSLRY